ncbi:MAG: hypothetical protein AB1324_08170 [Candidatus Micrarchaeota archaeon]
MRNALVLVLAAALLAAGCTFTGTTKIDQPSEQPSQPSAPPAAQPTETQPPPQPSQPPAETGCTFAGTWNTEWGEMVLVQNGSNVTGTYEFDDGRINGIVSGKTLTGTWSENSDENAYLPPDNAGDVQLNLTGDCNSLEGAWRYGSEGEFSGGWSGTRAD